MNDSNVFSEKNTESSLKTLPSEEKAKGIFPVAPPFLDDVPAAYLFRRIDGRILLGGELLSEGFEHRTVESPITLRSEDGNPYQPVLGTTPIADVSLMLKAVNCAAQAWNRGTGAWPTTRMEDRVKAVTRFRNLMKVKRQEVVTLLMWEICKTWNDACSEFDRTLAYIDDTIEAAKQLDREASRLQFAGGLMAQIRRMPLGVTLCMGPFNYPLNETFTTLIPALIMGNTTVVKLPRYGRLLWDPLLEAFAECFPPGVINVLNGEGRTVVGEAMSSGLIDVLAFIGSSRVANRIKSLHPHPHRLRGVLGLDAKNPAIVLEDANLEQAVAECVKGSLSFNGQRCTAVKIIYAHRTIAHKFGQLMAQAVQSLKVGLPWEEGVSITALPDPAKPQYLETLLQETLAEGADLLTKQDQHTRHLYFWPAVLGNVNPNSRLAHEEQFGPLVPIVTFDTEDEVLGHIVASEYGMQASIFSQDPSACGRLIDALSNQVCRINLNSQCQRGPDIFPFTGRKNSAEGTLSVTDALRAFSIRSMVAAKQDADGRRLVKSIMQQDTSRFLTSDIIL